MHEHIENLKPGDWITVVDDREEQFEDAEFGESWRARKIIPNFTGHPAKVLAVDFPFIVIEVYNVRDATKQKKDTIDVRRWWFKKLSAAYVKAFLPNAQVGPKPRKKKEKPDPRICPRCQQIRRTFLKDGEVELVCDECDKQKPKGAKIIVR